MWKWLIASLIFILIVVELVFFAPRPGDRDLGTNWDEKNPVENQPEKDIEQVLSGIHLVESDGSKLLWELDADQARKKKGSEDWRLDDVKVHFFGKDSVTYLATGREGFVGDNQKKLEISGDVEITSSNGYILNTEVIYYRAETRKIDGPEPVKLKGLPEEKGDGGPLYMESDFFDADLGTNIINLRQNVKGRKRMSGGRQMKIRSRLAIFSGESKEALFKDDVVIHVDATTITGPRAKFIYKNGVLHTLFIDGGVKIKETGRWGVAGEAEVFFQEDKFIFRDNPKVVQGDDQLVGDEIIVYDGGDRVQVRKAKTKYISDPDEEEGSQ